MAELHDLTALEAAAAVRRREVSPVELVEHALDRIDRLDAQVGAFVTVTADAALEQAQAAEQAVLDAETPRRCRRCSACRRRSRTSTSRPACPTQFGSRRHAPTSSPTSTTTS